MDMPVVDLPLPERLMAALREDAALSERQLSERLGTTRHALRRALAALRGQGELPPAPPRPSAARSLQAASVKLAQDTNPPEILEIRLALEPALARLAALRATPAEIARIHQAATTPPGANIAVTDVAFHSAVAAGARNGLAVALYGVLRRISMAELSRLPNGRRDVFMGERTVQRDLEHQTVAAAIADRDPDRAEAAMRAHLQAVGRKMMEQLTAGG